MKRKVLALFLFVLMALQLFAGCGGGSGTSDQAAPNDAPPAQGGTSGQAAAEEREPIAVPGGYTLPLAQTETTISFATEDNPQGTVSYSEYLPAWEEFTKRTNIKIDFQVIPTASYNENIQTRLAAGMNLPDMLRLPPDPMQYAESGLIIPLSDLIGQFAPNIAQLYNDQPAIRAATTAPDGNIYYVASILNARSIVNYQAPVYRKDWLERLGIASLETTDDWYAYLTGIRDNDMNGSGQNNEIPLSARNQAHLYIFAWSFGIPLEYVDNGAELEYWQIDGNGTVSSTWTNPRLKDWLEMMNKWYSEDLIDKDVIGDQPLDVFTAKVTSGLVGAASNFSMQTPQWTTNMQESDPDAYWEVAYPPKGPFGDQMLVRERPVSDVERYAVSRDCADPELAVKLIDYMYANREGQLLLGNFGVEGVSYEMVSGKPRFTELISGDPRGDGAALWEFGVNGPWPRILMTETIENRFFHFPQAENARDAAAKYQVEAFPDMISTRDESQKLAGTLSDITTYRQEMIANFITGRESLDNFDRYVSTIESMGIGELIKIKQAQYDRVYS